MAARPGWESTSVDSNARRAFVGAREIPLTATEFKILESLLDHPGWVVTHGRMSEELRDGADMGRSLGVHIANLRRKLHEAAASECIECVRGVGYRLVDTPDGSPATSDAPPVPMVGRESVLAAVDCWFGAALNGSGRILMIRGESGMGKTQVARAVAQAALHRGTPTLWAQCKNRDCDPPLLPLAELVLSGLGTETNDALADYPQVALMLRTVMGSRVARRRRASQVSLCRELITLVRDSTTPAGVLVVLEDIEAADRATLDILGLGLTRLVGVPVAVLLTCAENGRDASRALDDSLARVAASLDVIVLKPLPRSAVSILAHEFSGHPLGAATITRIHRLARGNPLAVRQVCLAMAGGARLAELSPPHEVFRIVEGEVTPAT